MAIKSSDEKHTRNRHSKILIGIAAAIMLGIMVGGFFPERALYFSILGKIFLNLLMMIVIPLVMLSMIVGITNLGDIRQVGAIGRRTIIYYVATTGLSVLIGMILVSIIKPGVGMSTGEKNPHQRYLLAGAERRMVLLPGAGLSRDTYDGKYMIILSDQKAAGRIKSVSPGGVEVSGWDRQEMREEGEGIEIALAMADKIKGKENRDVLSTISEVLVGDETTEKEGMIPRNIFNAMKRMDILPLIVFSLIFGAALSVAGDRGKHVIEILSVLNDAVLKIVDWIMLLAPAGIFGIIADRIGRAGGFSGFLPELLAVGKYCATVVLGLGIHGLILLPLILILIGRRNPFLYIRGVGAALLNAFSTASSSATLPLTMENVVRENNISDRTASFVLPIGATINMDGTALYEAVAAVFIAQVYGIDLGIFEQSIVFITATLAAIGAAGIPEAGLVTMVIVLKAVGLPVEGIGLILAVDWLLDRIRTTVNVWGDMVGAGVIETLETVSREKNIPEP